MVDAVNPLKKIVDIAIEQKVTHVISIGDDFDSEMTTAKQRKNFADEIGRLLAVGIKVGVVPGNHSRRFEYDAYRLGISVFDAPGWHVWGDMTIGSLPHMNYALLSDKLPAFKDYDREANKNILSILDTMLETEPTTDRLVLGHGVIDGAKLDNGFIPKPNGIKFPLGKLKRFKTLVRFGHYHLAQTLETNVSYVGSPSPVNFGEAGSDKGVEIVDFESGFPAATFMKIESPKIYSFNTHWDNGAFYPDPLQGEEPSFYKDSFVKIRYKVTQNNSGSVNLAFLEELNKHTLLPVAVEPDIQMDIVTRAPELRKPMDHREAVEVYWEHKGVPEEKKKNLIVLREKILEASL
jgi:DNA repair exonuclease SbcCD nuclease subunit